jgi:hypothetical protein
LPFVYQYLLELPMLSRAEQDQAATTVDMGVARCASILAGCAGRDKLECFQDLNHAVPVVRGKRLNRPALAKNFTGMRKNQFPHDCELAVVRVEPEIVNSPDLAGDELRVPREKTCRTCGLVLIGCFGSTREPRVLWLDP